VYRKQERDIGLYKALKIKFDFQLRCFGGMHIKKGFHIKLKYAFERHFRVAKPLAVLRRLTFAGESLNMKTDHFTELQ
jgi:hypothetical protein